MYKKNKRQSNKRWPLIIVSSILVIIVVGISVWVLNRPSEPNAAMEEDVLSAQPGTIKVLASLADTNKTVGAEPTNQSTVFDSIKLPSDWTEQNVDSVSAECDPSISIRRKIYVRGTQKLTIIEQKGPFACGAIITDTSLTYSIANNQSSLTVDRSVDVTQCTKEDAPSCPKGDGRINAVFKPSTPSDTSSNIYFTIEDQSTTEPFAMQIDAFITVVESLTIQN